MGGGNKYNLNDPDLQYIISNAQLDTQPQNVNLIYSFVNDMNFNTNYGDKKSKRYYFIKDLINQNISSDLLSTIPIRKWNKFDLQCFFPSDSDELVDKLILIVLEKIGGNDNPMLSEQIITIADKLLDYECITANQHQNIVSAFNSWIMNLFKKDPFVD